MASSAEGYNSDDDRLPWLETVDDDYDEGPGAFRIILMVLLGLGVIAAAIFGYYYWQQMRGADGDGALIAAQEGDYKVKPDDPGGLKVEGEGEVAVATSDGAAPGKMKIDPASVPEKPIATAPAPTKAVDDAAKAASKVIAAVPGSGGKLVAAPPVPAAAKPVASAGALVQLGSFPDEAAANAAWAKASKRFAFLAPLGKSIVKADVNGRSVYRLRVNAGSAAQAGELCGKLKVAGEACFVASN